MKENNDYTNLTILLPAGRLPLTIMSKVSELAEKYPFSIYLSTQQNLRLTNVLKEHEAVIREKLLELGAEFKGPGKFPIPRICVGSPHCNLGVIDTEAFSLKILDHFSGRKHTKAKLKIAVSGCTLSCAGTKTSDIGLLSTRNGFEIYVGGKGGSMPKVGRRIKQGVDESEALTIIEELVNFHERKTGKKQRMYKLLSDPEFPYQEE